MAKPKNPLLSFNAFGSLARTLTFRRTRGATVAEKKPIPHNPKSPAQRSWRHMYQKCAALWHTLSVAEMKDWERLARPLHMTGFAYWQSQCLKPNPGIYLPLQGGIMQGEIDMDGWRIQNLPLAVDNGEPLTLAFYLANIAPYLYQEGCRVTFDGAQDIPKLEFTAIDFDTERWDTDNIHSLVLNSTRLTCRTAGKYIITGCVSWSGSLVGKRQLLINLNDTNPIALTQNNPCPGGLCFHNITTVWNLSVDDFVELVTYHTSNVSLTIDSLANYSPEFAMQRIGN